MIPRVFCKHCERKGSAVFFAHEQRFGPVQWILMEPTFDDRQKDSATVCTWFSGSAEHLQQGSLAEEECLWSEETISRGESAER